jgi:hypothetical protein
MSNNKQSSVEWLIEQILLKHPIITQFLPNWNFDKSIIEQAKAMHKEEMIEFCYSWSHERADKNDIDQDYNETFNNEQTN